MKVCTIKLKIIDVPENVILINNIEFKKLELENSSVYISENFL